MKNIFQKLTAKQQKVFKVLQTYYEEHGVTPTILELQAMLGVRSVRTVTQYLEALEKKGLIYRKPNQKRGIELIDIGPTLDHETVMLPVIASAGCDNALVFAEQYFDAYVAIDRKFLPKDDHDAQFVLIKAVGDSMQGAGIESGDYVVTRVLENNVGIKEGDRVVAIIGDTAVIKRISFRENAIVLSPESKSKVYKPIIMREDFKIFGKVVDIIKMSIQDKDEELYYDYGDGGK